MKDRTAIIGAPLIAVLLVMGPMVPATAEGNNDNASDEPNACQYLEYEYERTVETVETSELQANAPDGDGWESIHSEEVVVQDEQTATFYEWQHQGNDDIDWVIEGEAKNSPPWFLTGESEVRITHEEVTETHHIYERTVMSTTSEWFTSDPGGDWVATGDTRIVDIPGCDLFELDPSNPAAGQCPAEEGAIKLDTGDSYSETVMVDGVGVLVTVGGTNITFSESVEFCVKASNGNSGFQSGTYYDVDFVNRGGQYPTISNVVIYGLVDVQPETFTVRLFKDWVGDAINHEGVDVELFVDVNGVPHPDNPFLLVSPRADLVPHATFEVEAGDDVEVTGERVSGFDEANPGCDFTSSFPYEQSITEDMPITATNTVDCDEEIGSVTITLVKEWFDLDGNRYDSSPGLPWSLELYTTSEDGQTDHTEALLLGPDWDDPRPYEPGPVTTEPFDLTGDGVRYGVREDIAEDIFVVVDCDTVTTETSYDEQGLRTTNDPPVYEDTVHLVCNQEQPAPVVIGLYKVWLDADGEFIEDMTQVPEFAVTLSVDDDVLATLDEDTPWAWTGPMELGTEYVVSEPTLPDGWVLTDCPVDVYDPELGAATADGVGTFTADGSGRHFVCNQQIPDIPPTTVDIGLLKVWLDVDGSVMQDPPVVDFEITLTVGDQVTTVDQTTPSSGAWTTMEFATEYVVSEPTVPDGWERTDCPALIYGPEGGAVADGVGTFTAEEGGRHFVCNQAEVQVLPIIIEREPEREPEPKPATEVKGITEVKGVTQQLPTTGRNSDGLLWLVTAMLLAGAAILTVERRYRMHRRQ